MTAADPRCARLSELSECAYRLGVAFGREAEQAEDTARKLEYFRLFDRCFFSVRVAIALELRLSRAPVAAPAERDEDLADRADPSEDERPDSETRLERERFEADRDREREVEAVAEAIFNASMPMGLNVTWAKLTAPSVRERNAPVIEKRLAWADAVLSLLRTEGSQTE